MKKYECEKQLQRLTLRMHARLRGSSRLQNGRPWEGSVACAHASARAPGRLPPNEQAGANTHAEPNAPTRPHAGGERGQPAGIAVADRGNGGEEAGLNEAGRPVEEEGLEPGTHGPALRLKVLVLCA